MAGGHSEPFGNRDLLVSALGRWPSFHDSSVVDFVCDGDTYEVSIHVFEMTTDIDPRGHYVLRNHHLVTLRLSGVERSTLPTGYKHDILFDLSAERVRDLIKVDFDSVMNEGGEVECKRIEVVKVVPCSPEGDPVV
jgi:hypothetical protein